VVVDTTHEKRYSLMTMKNTVLIVIGIVLVAIAANFILWALIA